jgi:hypothetical protein
MLDVESTGYIPPEEVVVEKKKISPFDFVKSITETKEDIFDQNSSSYNKFIIDKALSFNLDCVFFAAEIARYPNVPDNAHYQFYLNSIDKKKRYGGWQKKDSIPEDVELIKEAFGYSTKDAMSALDVMSDKQLLDLKEKMSKGGRYNDPKRRHSV